MPWLKLSYWFSDWCHLWAISIGVERDGTRSDAMHMRRRVARTHATCTNPRDLHEPAPMFMNPGAGRHGTRCNAMHARRRGSRANAHGGWNAMERDVIQCARRHCRKSRYCAIGAGPERAGTSSRRLLGQGPIRTDGGRSAMTSSTSNSSITRAGSHGREYCENHAEASSC